MSVSVSVFVFVSVFVSLSLSLSLSRSLSLSVSVCVSVSAARAAVARRLTARAGTSRVHRLVDLCAVVIARFSDALGLELGDALHHRIPLNMLPLVVAVGLRCPPLPSALLQIVRAGLERPAILDLSGSPVTNTDLAVILSPAEGTERTRREAVAWARARGIDTTLLQLPMARPAATPLSWETLDDSPLPTSLPLFPVNHIHTLRFSGCRSLNGGTALLSLIDQHLTHLRRLYLDDAFISAEQAHATVAALEHVQLQYVAHLDLSRNRFLADDDFMCLLRPDVLPALHCLVAVDCALVTRERLRGLLYHRATLRHVVTTDEEASRLTLECASGCGTGQSFARSDR